MVSAPRLHTLARTLLASLVGALVACNGCSSRPGLDGLGPDGGSGGTLAGTAVKGPIAGGTVHVYRLNGTAVGEEIATAITGNDGTFAVSLGLASGPFYVAVAGGAFMDEASGLSVNLNTDRLTALVPTFASGSSKTGLLITPASTLATALALHWMTAESATAGDAYAEAFQHLNTLFGVDLQASTPINLTTATGVSFDSGAKAGLMVAALSQEAAIAGSNAALTPGSVNALTLLDLLVLDAQDGYLDGAGPAGALVLPVGGAVHPTLPTAYALDGRTLRATFAVAIARFLNSSKNTSGLTVADANALITAIAGNSDTRIFRDPGSLADVTAPTVTVTSPANGAGLHGTVSVTITAQDPSRVTSLAVTGNAVLAALTPTYSSDGTTATLTGSWDVSALPDGPIALTVTALDSYGNQATTVVTPIVNSHGPTISVSAPSASSTLNGTITISATASAANGSVTSLGLTNPPAGVGADTLPAAGAFSASWDTTQSLEGDVTLTFHATDSLGGSTDLPVVVHVDNVPFGLVHVALSAGAPIAGATVKLLAIDNSTGLPLTTRPGGAVLGQGSVTAADGTLTFSLTQENYTGPVQLVASGTSLSYVDPTDGTTTISIPSAFQFTSYLANYSAGQSITGPLTLWTTIADSASLAYAQGHNPAQTVPTTLTLALGVTDPLFAKHISRSSPPDWPLRPTVPVSLTQAATQTLRDVVYAAFPDVSLNQEARTISTSGGLVPGAVVTAPTLTAQLQQDIADGLFDGLAGAASLQTAGSPPYQLSSTTTRVDLANALQTFVKSAQNHTGLTSPNLQTAHIYDDLASDVSLLYPNGAPPAFDNAAPAVSTFGVTFLSGLTGSSSPPVGAANQVRGTITVSVDVTDPSNVVALDVRVNGTPITPAGSGNTLGGSSAHWSGSFDTTGVADGPLTLVVHASDGRGNTADYSQAVVTVDNTAPTISTAAPSSGQFYNAGVAVDSTASDTGGINDLTVTGLSGFSDTDSSASHVAGTWSIPGPQADGSVTATFTTHDAVGNVASSTTTFKVDRTAPTITLVSGPPAYTNASSVNITVDAADGAGPGVRSVSASWTGPGGDSGGPTTATFSGGHWSLSTPIQLHAEGAYTFTVWAEDLVGAAGTGNSGQTKASPYLLTLTTTRDTSVPVPEFVSVGAYKDERGMGIATDGSGRAIAPPSYVPAGAWLSIDEGVSIWKAQTRRHGQATPDANELSGANATNTPFVKIRVPWSVTAAPVSGAGTSNLACINSTCSALLFLNSDLSYQYFLFPISADNSADLAAASSGSVALTINITVTDAAGNTSSAITRHATYNYVGAPVATVVDSSYTAAGAENDAHGVAFFRYSQSNFNQLWASPNPSRFPSPYLPRVTRILISNPAPEPVLITTPLTSATVAIQDTWVDHVVSQTAGTLPIGYPQDWETDIAGGNSCPQFNSYSKVICPDWGSTGEPTVQEPLWGTNADGSDGDPRFAWLTNVIPSAYSINPIQCRNTSGGALTNGSSFSHTYSTLSLSPQAFITSPGQAPGSDTTLATTSGGNILVPAAVGSTPGMIAVYLVRPLEAHNSPTRETYDMTDPAGIGSAATNKASRLLAYVWRSPTSGKTNPYSCCSFNSCVHLQAVAIGSVNTSPREHLSGSWAVKTWPNTNPASGSTTVLPSGTSSAEGSGSLSGNIDHSL